MSLHKQQDDSQNGLDEPLVDPNINPASSLPILFMSSPSPGRSPMMAGGGGRLILGGGAGGGGNGVDDKEGGVTIDEILEQIGIGPWQIGILASQCLLAMTAAALTQMMEFLSGCAGEDWNLSSLQQASLTSAIFIGAASTAAPWGIVSDRFGRKISLFTFAALVAFFSFLSAASTTFIMLLLLRVFTGMCLGAKALPYAYVSETMPPKWRARFMSLLTFVWALGSLYVNVLAWIILTTVRVGLGWRVLVIVSTLPAAVAYMLMLRYLSESPRWLLVQHKREEEALESLRYIASHSNLKLPLVLPTDTHLLQSVPNSPAPPANAARGPGLRSYAFNSPNDSPLSSSSPPTTYAPSGGGGEPSSPANGGGGASGANKSKAPRTALGRKGIINNANGRNASSSPHGSRSSDSNSRYAPTTSKFAFYLLLQQKYVMQNVYLTIAWLMQGFTFFGIVDYAQLLSESEDDDDDDNDDDNSSCTFNYLVNNVSCVGQVLACLLIIFIIDRFKRKTLALSCFALAATVMPLFAISKWNSLSDTIANIIACIAAFFGRGAGAGAFSVLYVITPELYPTALRATVTSLGIMMHLIAAIAVPYWISCNAVNSAEKAGLVAAASLIGFCAILPLRETRHARLGDLDEVKRRTASGSYITGGDGDFIIEEEEDDNEGTESFSSNSISGSVAGAGAGAGAGGAGSTAAAGGSGEAGNMPWGSSRSSAGTQRSRRMTDEVQHEDD